MASAAVDKRTQSYRRLSIYGTKSRLYVVGHDEQLGICRILKFRRQDGPRLDVVEDPIVYTPEQCNLVLRKVHEQSGGLQLICKGHGIIGCFRFTDSYYLLVIARREYIGHICGHKVYRIAETSVISLSASQLRIDMAAADSTAEKRYRKLLLGVDLTKNFFFSYSYSLAHTLQHNHTQAAAAAATTASASPTTKTEISTAEATQSNSSNSSSRTHTSDPAGGTVQAAAAAAAAALGWDVYDSSMFVWNAYLTRPLRAAIHSTKWTLPLVHGYWEQRQVSVFGRQLTLTLLGRRSRHFAGTRYRKRGLSAQGFVANEVETEQIVDAGIDWSTGQPLWSSMVQVRGSVPLFWSQQATTLSPKPDIVLQQFDPVYEKTAAHFADMRRRYGHPIMALNLLKSKERRPRETLLRNEYALAVQLVNSGLPPQQQIIYIPWDFNRHAKHPGANILLDLAPILNLCLDTSGIYVHGPASCSSCKPLIHARFTSRAAAAAAQSDPAAAAAALQVSVSNPTDAPNSKPQGPKQRYFAPKTQLQQGVLRTNCIDCLDRTNVVQFAYGLAAFGRQLMALGVLSSDERGVDSDSSIAFQLMEMYEGMGHTLALQYGGSEAHAAFFQKKRGEWDATTQSRDLMTSIRRFYSNAYTDAEKQDAINLFLGNYVPMANAPPLWELTDDYYLHRDAAMRYSHVTCSDRVLSTAAAAADASTAAVAAPPMMSAGGRNAPVLLRQLSATTLPVSAFGFGDSNHTAAAAASSTATTAAASSRPTAAWISPFAAAVSNAASAAAGSAIRNCQVSSPLLPLTYSDGISIDASELDMSPSSADGAFNFKIVFQQMLSPAEQAPLAPAEPRSAIVSFDNVLAKLPRARPVRLYPVTTRNNVMWEAVQQAFAFFSSGEAAAADGASVGSSSSGQATGAAASSGDGAATVAASSIQTLDLTQQVAKRQQQQVLITSSSNASAAPQASGDSSSIIIAAATTADSQILESPSRSSGSSKTASAAAAAGMSGSSQIFNALTTISAGLRSPPAPPVSNLNDILEIRTDVAPFRMISNPNKPPQAIGPQGPVVAPPTLLDATLDELMWSQFGINVSSTKAPHQQQQQRNSPTTMWRLGSGFTGTQPGSPIEANPSVTDRVWGTVTNVVTNAVRGRSSTTAAVTAGSTISSTNATTTVSALNDIIQVQKSPPDKGTAAAAAVGSSMLTGGSSRIPATSAAAAATAAGPSATDGSSSSSGGAGSSSSVQQRAMHPTAGRVTFTPAGTAAAAGSSCAHAAAAATRLHIGSTGVLPWSPVGSPRASVSGCSAAAAAAGDESEWMIVNGHAVRITNQEGQRQQQHDTARTAAAAAAAADAAAADGWSSPFKLLRMQQQQQSELQQQPSLQPQQLFAHFLGAHQCDAAAAAKLAAQEQCSRAAAAKQRQQQQQRIDSFCRMTMPVDAAAAAAAFGLHNVEVSTQQDLPQTAHDYITASSNITEQQQQRYWISSADLSAPTLRDWAARAEDCGLAPEVQAVWWGLGDMHEVWGIAEEGSKEAYVRYCKAVSGLCEEGSCSQLRGWYEQQQFRSPVVISAA